MASSIVSAGAAEVRIDAGHDVEVAPPPLVGAISGLPVVRREERIPGRAWGGACRRRRRQVRFRVIVRLFDLDGDDMLFEELTLQAGTNLSGDDCPLVVDDARVTGE